MADPRAVEAGMLESVWFPVNASAALHERIRDTRSQETNAQALEDEVSDLNTVLRTLLDTVATNPNINFQALNFPLQRCGHSCEEFGKIIQRHTQNSSSTERPSISNWAAMRYLQGDINDFRGLLAGYKSTISIALAAANLSIAAISPEVLENYEGMTSDTIKDLGTHLSNLESRLDSLQARDAAVIDNVAIESNSFLEERQRTLLGLGLCAQLAAQFATPFEHEDENLTSTLRDVDNSIQVLRTRLQIYDASISHELGVMSLKDGFSVPFAEQRAQLQQTVCSVRQCTQIVSKAGGLADERSNVFEDITKAKDSSFRFVATLNDLVMMRRGPIRPQLSADAVQKTVALRRLLASEHQAHLSYVSRTSQGPP